MRSEDFVRNHLTQTYYAAGEKCVGRVVDMGNGSCVRVMATAAPDEDGNRRWGCVYMLAGKSGQLVDQPHPFGTVVLAGQNEALKASFERVEQFLADVSVEPRGSRKLPCFQLGSVAPVPYRTLLDEHLLLSPVGLMRLKELNDGSAGRSLKQAREQTGCTRPAHAPATGHARGKHSTHLVVDAG